MTEPKFTKGGWNRNVKPASHYPVIFAGRNTHVAVVSTRGLSEEEIEANCDLITASPKLYAALADLLGDLPDVQDGICRRCGRDYTGDIVEGNCPSDDCPAHVARAALIAARGHS